MTTNHFHFGFKQQKRRQTQRCRDHGKRTLHAAVTRECFTKLGTTLVLDHRRAVYQGAVGTQGGAPLRKHTFTQGDEQSRMTRAENQFRGKKGRQENEKLD